MNGEGEHRKETREREGERERAKTTRETFWFPGRVVIHRDNLSGKLHLAGLRIDGFVTRFWNSRDRRIVSFVARRGGSIRLESISRCKHGEKVHRDVFAIKFDHDPAISSRRQTAARPINDPEKR